MENQTKCTWRINIQQKSSNISFAEKISSKEEAVKFALSIHEASNVPHVIYVLHDDIIDVTFTRYETTA